MIVTRPGTAAKVKKVTKRHPRRCMSAPSVPGNVVLSFHKRREDHRKHYVGRVDWAAVTTDVAGRPLTPHLYDVELRATDASGEPVETRGQETASTADGKSFSVLGGTAPTNRNARELNATGDLIGNALSSLTPGIACKVKFFARAQSGSPNLRYSVYDTTSGSEVVGKVGVPDSTRRPKLVAAMVFTPVGGHSYQARVNWANGSGVGLLDHVKWHDEGDNAVWRLRVKGDETAHAVFWLTHPDTWFYQARVRALNHTHHARCYSAWSGWTTSTRPSDGETTGPPAPDGLIMTFDKVNGTRKRPWRLKAVWNETPWWIPPDGEPEEGSDHYAVHIQMSNNAGTTVAHSIRHVIEARDQDADQTSNYKTHVQGRRHYRFRVRAIQSGRRGAWSSFTAWASPHGAPNPVLNVTWSNPTPAVLVAKWDPPADLTDVDRYRVRVIRSGSVVDDGFTSGNRWIYHIPKVYRGVPHKVRVNAQEEETTTDVDPDEGSGAAGWTAALDSTDTDSTDLTNTESWSGTDLVIDLSSFPPDVRPTAIVSVLPPLPDTLYPNGSLVLLATNWKLYRNAAGVWTAAVATTDLTGQITSTQITDDAVTTPKILAGAVTAAEIAGGTITGDKIQAGTITAGLLAVTSLDAISVNAGTLTAGTIQGLKITTESPGGFDQNWFEMQGGTDRDKILFMARTGGIFGGAQGYFQVNPATAAEKITLVGRLFAQDPIRMGVAGPGAPSAGIYLYCRDNSGTNVLAYKRPNGTVISLTTGT